MNVNPLLVAAILVASTAGASPCEESLIRELKTIYDKNMVAAKAGDLSTLKRTSTSSESAAIESSAGNNPNLGRMIYSFSPRLAGAKQIQCERSGEKARLIVTHDVVEESAGKVVGKREGHGVVMFHREGGVWKVGKRASTQPFAQQSLSELLSHEALQLP